MVGAQGESLTRLLSVNTGFGVMLEYGTGELQDEPITRLISQDDQLGWIAELQRLIRGDIDKLNKIVKFIQRGGKHYVTCHCWAWRLLDHEHKVDSVLLHMRALPEFESEAAKREHDFMLARLERVTSEMEVMRGQWEAFRAANSSGDRDVVVNVGDRVGDNIAGSTKNDLGPFKWIAIVLMVIVLGWAYAEYYRQGGKEPPKIPQLEKVE